MKTYKLTKTSRTEQRVLMSDGRYFINGVEYYNPTLLNNTETIKLNGSSTIGNIDDIDSREHFKVDTK